MSKKRTPGTYTVRWHFEGGDKTMPLQELVAQLQRQAHAMAVSEDAVLRAQGRRLIAEAAELQAAATGANAMRGAVLKKKARPKAKQIHREASATTTSKIRNLCTDLDRQRVPKHKWAGIAIKRLGISRATFSRRAPTWAKRK